MSKGREVRPQPVDPEYRRLSGLYEAQANSDELGSRNLRLALRQQAGLGD